MPRSTFLPIFLVAFVGVVLSAGSNDEPSVRSLSNFEMRMAEEAGYSYVDRLAQLEEELYAKGVYVKEGSPSYRMSKFKQPSKEVIDVSRKNMRFIETVRFLKKELGLNDQELEHNLMRYTNEANTGCMAPVTCYSAKYRTIDGSCNSVNVNLTRLGQSVTTYRRLFTPAYLDGISSPRTNSSINTTTNALPSARLVSTTVFQGADVPLSNVTNLMMQFGQFVNHDMESTTSFTFANGTGYSCCTSNNSQLDTTTLNSLGYCFPISVPTTDPFLNNIPNKPAVRQTCMNFVRSSTGPNRISCNFAPISYADQINQNSHWLDVSTTYGSDNATSASLRSSSNGLLLTSTDSARRQLLPVSPSNCSSCFLAGDSRATEQPQLTVMHTIWMREHNRIAKTLATLNPSWSSETVFQEARRIVIAEYQHITYNEFLPTLLGKTAMATYGLSPLPAGTTFSNYTTANLTSGPISNEFATAAFRMGHSLVQGSFQLVDSSGNITTFNMSDYFNNPAVVYTNQTFFDSVIRGLVQQPSQTVDTQVSAQLWLQLFRILSIQGPPVGSFDIVALNIQRGRDHGLPSYNTYRQFCGFPALVDPINNVTLNIKTQLASSIPVFSQRVVDNLASVYSSVNDIDLYVGGLAEISTLGDGILGPTFTCLIAENFKQLKYGDRYFYENGANPNLFNSTLLTEIKKATMARILCDNSDGTVQNMQPLAFVANGAVVGSTTNVQVPCSNTVAIPKMNLNLWQGLSV